MKDIVELLPALEGAEHIRQCWGDIPPFRWGELLHVKQSGWHAQQKAMLTAIFWTHGPEDLNECNPSRIVFEFSGVVYWEYGSCLAQENGIPMDDLLASPPPGNTTVYVQHEFYVVCRSVRVVSCVRESFGPSNQRHSLWGRSQSGLVRRRTLMNWDVNVVPRRCSVAATGIWKRRRVNGRD